MKGTDKKISMITAYDYTMAKIVDESGVNTILVGDSLGNTILGYEDTISVTVDDMIHHSAAVARGAKNALVITDMPFFICTELKAYVKIDMRNMNICFGLHYYRL